MTDSGRTWFITGTSRGFGRAFAEAALDRGDRVAATARRREDVADLVAEHGERIAVISLDVTDRERVFDAVAEAVAAFGRLDVVVNNAGFGLLAAIEEASEAEVREQFETNFFGALWVTQAALPVLRRQGHGHIVQVTSLGGILAFPAVGIYNASKWALEAVSESLAREVGQFGINVTCLEPGGFRTDWWGSSLKRAVPMPEYDGVLAAQRASMTAEGGSAKPGDPALAAQALIQIVESPDPPRRVLLGNVAFDSAMKGYQGRMAEWRRWEHVSRTTDS